MLQSLVEANIESRCEKIKGTLIEKNKMYGDSFFKTLEEYGDSLICGSWFICINSWDNYYFIKFSRKRQIK